MQRPRIGNKAILTLVFSGVAAGMPAPVLPQPLIPSLTSLLGVDRSVNDALSGLEATAQRLIAEFTERFGATVDKQTQRAFQQLTAMLQSSRMAYSDVLTETVGAIGQQRAAMMHEIARTLMDLESNLDKGIARLELTEQRFSSTLEAASRARPIPVLLGVEPSQYRADEKDALPLTITGKHLAHPDNRIIAAGQEFKASSVVTNNATYLIPRDALSPDKDGYTKLSLRVHEQDTAWFPWAPWHTPPAPATFPILLRPLGARVGTYTLQTTYPTGSAYVVVREKRWWASTSEQDLQAWPFPPPEQMCIKPKPGTEFDPSSTKLTILKNTFYRQAYGAIKRVSAGPVVMQIPTQIPESEVPGPANPAEIRYNTPELICVFVPRHVSEVVLDINGARIARTRRLQTELFYRVRSLELEKAEFLDSGEITWSGDTETKQLPAKHEGFRLRVEFDGGDRRVFTGTDRYGPLEVRFDPTSRVVVIRPISQ